MKEHAVTMVRVYLTEGEHLLKELLKLLHDKEQVRGVTVFRGISGFGKTGQVHQATLLDVSFDLPLVVEFFEDPERAQQIIEDLQDVVEADHIVSWPAVISNNRTRNA